MTEVLNLPEKGNNVVGALFTLLKLLNELLSSFLVLYFGKLIILVIHSLVEGHKESESLSSLFPCVGGLDLLNEGKYLFV